MSTWWAKILLIILIYILSILYTKCIELSIFWECIHCMYPSHEQQLKCKIHLNSTHFPSYFKTIQQCPLLGKSLCLHAIIFCLIYLHCFHMFFTRNDYNTPNQYLHILSGCQWLLCSKFRRISQTQLKLLHANHCLETDKNNSAIT